jgi:ATP-dependent DNA helicase RecQ
MDDKPRFLNAFGMGMTKQMSRPLFTYNFQKISKIIIKAGRSGRNGEKAFAVLLTNPSDIKQQKTNSTTYSP